MMKYKSKRNSLSNFGTELLNANICYVTWWVCFIFDDFFLRKSCCTDS